jgi:GDP-D-mannose dehydratase
MLQFKKKYKLKYTAVILFNHVSLFRKKKFLIPRIIKAIKNKNYLFINHIIKSNIWADFSHAEDICNGIYKIINSKTNYDSFILSSGKSTSVNQIILHIIRKYHCKLNISIKRIKKNINRR